MANRPKQPCRWPGCPRYRVTRDGYCEGHKFAARQRDELRRPAAVRHRWAVEVKRRDGCCVLCGHVGTPANPLEADHIVPLAWGGSPYSLTNGRALCHRCHVAEHRRRAAEAKRNGW
jgi:5-methylcytosine-specific restriction protein A